VKQRPYVRLLPDTRLDERSSSQQYLRPGLTLATLHRIAGLRSDTEAARRMQQAKHLLFEQLRKTA
jgi:hypothetical protein